MPLALARFEAQKFAFETHKDAVEKGDDVLIQALRGLYLTSAGVAAGGPEAWWDYASWQQMRDHVTGKHTD